MSTDELLGGNSLAILMARHSFLRTVFLFHLESSSSLLTEVRKVVCVLAVGPRPLPRLWHTLHQAGR